MPAYLTCTLLYSWKRRGTNFVIMNNNSNDHIDKTNLQEVR